MKIKTFLIPIIIVLLFLTIRITAQNNDTLCIKIASVYQNISIGEGSTGFVDMPIEIKEIKDSKTDFIYRGFWRWVWAPDSAAVAPTPDYEQLGYTYKQLINAINEIKDSIPGIIISGSIPAQKIDSLEINDLTGDTLHSDSTWAMALDPSKWGVPVSKITIQNYLASMLYNNNGSYFPDITNTDFQSLLIDWAKKQINCGMDAILIDMLYSQARIMGDLTSDINHKSVQESYNAATHIIDEIHNYGTSIGKYIYVGTWTNVVIRMPYPKPQLDFVVESISSDEILNDSLETIKWVNERDSIINILGNIPILVCLDWGFQNSPLEVFSQQLDPLQQRSFIANADSFFYAEDMTFVYPLHGGYVGESATILSYGVSHIYHAAAPEFATLDTIIALGTAKNTLPWYCDNATAISEQISYKSNAVLVFPNPLNMSVTFQIIDERNPNYELEIFNMLGNIVFQKTLFSKQETIAMNLPSGIYFYKITGKNHFLSSGKLIIAK